MTDDEPKLTAAEIKNGWDADSLAAYRREREQAHGLVGGFQITIMPEGWRRKREPEFEHAGRWSVFKHKLIR